MGSDALCFRADVTKTDELDAFIDAALSRCGRLDGADNNAGRTAGSSVAESDDETWRQDIELKVISALHVSRRVLSALEVTKGAIINVLAIMARTPGANSTPTTTSRAAGLALSKAMANEVGPRGVRVSAILVGLIESGQWVRRAKEADMALDDFYFSLASGSKILLGRVGRTESLPTSPRSSCRHGPVTSRALASVSTEDSRRSSSDVTPPDRQRGTSVEHVEDLRHFFDHVGGAGVVG